MPQTWRGTHEGDREYVTQLHRDWERRERLEQQYPELAGDTRPVLAHEGRFQHQPLRQGDPVPHSHAGSTAGGTEQAGGSGKSAGSEQS
jgi:hypothetical protein